MDERRAFRTEQHVFHHPNENGVGIEWNNPCNAAIERGKRIGENRGSSTARFPLANDETVFVLRRALGGKTLGQPLMIFSEEIDRHAGASRNHAVRMSKHVDGGENPWRR